MHDSDTFDHEIAVIGMAGRFPGARNLDEFWQNLRNGVESISFFSDQEVLSSGVDPRLLRDPRYVRARGILQDIELFDASFFGFSPRETEVMDPQHRLFLECAWEALENAGYDTETYHGRIGVYAGVSASSYLEELCSNHDLVESLDSAQLTFGNQKDFFSTRVSYKLNLKGPSVTVQTACSTSLVATHLACQSLLNGEADMALAGGISISVPQRAGYLFQEGSVHSPEGHCRAFDAGAQGIVGGNGGGVVVLKLLADAIADGDCIYAVIKGSAINNDGSLKVGYTAPSVNGQAEVIAEALATAGIEPETVTYIETHGTGTPMGDPIEIAALTRAFRARTNKKAFCAIGSVKTNIGHLDAAAGVAGLIKTILALKHRSLPPSLHFEQPNPKIDFANSPFYVNAEYSEWRVDGFPRRAGVSSFGIGGTNAHVLLEEAPPLEIRKVARPEQLLVLSAKTGSALESATDRLAAYLRQHSDLDLANVAYTLHMGRRSFNHRRTLVCHDLNDAVTALQTRDPQRVLTTAQEPGERPVVFMFPGGGTQYVGMGLDLYHTEAVFREQLDFCAELLKPHLGIDLRHALFPTEELRDAATRQMRQTALALPALFVTEYALAKLWMSWGVLPEAMIGHSLGEYVAACLAGVFSLQNALALVAKRGQLLEQLPGGAMLSVPLPEQEVRPLLDGRLSLAAINGPLLCVVSGPTDAIDELQRSLGEKGVEVQRLRIDAAGHSEVVEPILEAFTAFLETLPMQAPRVPYISNITGTWITAAEATDPHYWARHLRRTVRFADGMHEILQRPERVLLEVGPGQTLSILARQQMDSSRRSVALSSLRHPQDPKPERTFLLNTLGQLWLQGVHINWSGFYANERHQRIPLPTYPFERQRYWVEPRQLSYQTGNSRSATGRKPNTVNWLYLPSWKRSVPPELPTQQDLAQQNLCYLVLADAFGLGSQMIRRLEQGGQRVITVAAGDQFRRVGDASYRLNPCRQEDYADLIAELRTQDKLPDKLVHLWSITPDGQAPRGSDSLETPPYGGFYSLLLLCQALNDLDRPDPLEIVIVSSNVQEVTGEEVLSPERAAILGPCTVIPQEYPHIVCRAIDIAFPRPGTWQEEQLIDHLAAELMVGPPDQVIAYRVRHRWVQIFEPACLNGAMPEKSPLLREGGAYLVIGGLEGWGFALTKYLAQTVHAKLIILEPAPFPTRDEWGQWLATHGDMNSTGRAIKHARALEEMGAELFIVGADAADQEQVQEAIDQADERFGHLHGLIYTAGSAEQTSPDTAREPDYAKYERLLQSRMRELSVLEQVLRDRKLDFCLLYLCRPSLATSADSCADAAANHLTDVFIRRHNQTHPIPWTSASCGTWQLVEVQGQGIVPEAATPTLTVTPQEIVEVFQHLLSLGRAMQVVVSAEEPHVKTGRRPQPQPAPGEERVEEVNSMLLHPRPDLQNPYVAPSNELERTIAIIWYELLGIDQVGIHDNFFELGGHSLMAAQLISRLRETFSMEVPLQSIFAKPTIAGLAETIEELFLEKIEALSEEEAQQLMSNVLQHHL